MNRHILMAGFALALGAAGAAHANTVDGVISPGEYATATKTSTPYSPGADTTLSTFGSGNELVSENIYFGADTTRNGFDTAIQTTPAGQGNDKADQSLGANFSNLYFGNPTEGAYVVFELGNQRAVNLNTNQTYAYSGAALGIEYNSTLGTTYANGGKGSVSETYIPYAAYEQILAQIGIPVSTGDIIQLRDVQAFSYAGNNGSPAGSRFGSVVIADAPVSAAPEPGVWSLMLGGVGAMGLMLRRRREVALAA